MKDSTRYAVLSIAYRDRNDDRPDLVVHAMLADFESAAIVMWHVRGEARDDRIYFVTETTRDGPSIALTCFEEAKWLDPGLLHLPSFDSTFIGRRS
jgi:hypothetical protein